MGQSHYSHCPTIANSTRRIIESDLYVNFKGYTKDSYSFFVKRIYDMFVGILSQQKKIRWEFHINYMIKYNLILYDQSNCFELKTHESPRRSKIRTNFWLFEQFESLQPEFNHTNYVKMYDLIYAYHHTEGEKTYENFRSST